MKRCLGLVLCLLWLPFCAFAEDIDLSVLTRNELLTLQERLSLELTERPVPDEAIQSRIRSLAEAACADNDLVFSEDWEVASCSLDWGLGILDATVYVQSGIILSPRALHAEALLNESGDRLTFLSVDEAVLLDERDAVTDVRARALLGLVDEEEPSVERSLPNVDAPSDSADEFSYVVNANTRKFHLPTCSSVADIQSANRLDVTADRNELIAEGYAPCKRCNP